MVNTFPDTGVSTYVLLISLIACVVFAGVAAQVIGSFTFTTVVVVLEQPTFVKLYVTVWLPLVLAAKLITPVEALILKPASEVNVPPDSPDTNTEAVPVGQNGPPGYEIVAIGNGLITTTTGLIVSHKFNEASALPLI